MSQQSAKVDAVRQQLGNVNTMSVQSEIVNAVRTKSKDSFPLSRKILPWLAREIEMQKEIFRQQQENKD